MQKLVKLIRTNKQLIAGLVIGALIMLPTGLYLSERASNNQRMEAPEATSEVPSNTEKTAKETTQQPSTTTPTTPTQSTQQPATQQTKKVDLCPSHNKAQQDLLNGTINNSAYSSYTIWKNYVSADNTRTEQEKKADIADGYEDYKNSLAKSKSYSEQLIRNEGCTPTLVTPTLKPR